MDAYPEAAVILTVRESEDKWYDSMMATLIHAHTHAPDPNPSPMAPLARLYHLFCVCCCFLLGMVMYQIKPKRRTIIYSPLATPYEP